MKVAPEGASSWGCLRSDSYVRNDGVEEGEGRRGEKTGIHTKGYYERTIMDNTAPCSHVHCSNPGRLAAQLVPEHRLRRQPPFA
eukprot:scaffold13851_cov124-Isochrysis_galbana.AAC.2